MFAISAFILFIELLIGITLARLLLSLFKVPRRLWTLVMLIAVLIVLAIRMIRIIT